MIAITKTSISTRRSLEWKLTSLKRCFSVVGGSTPKSEVQEYWDGDIDWVTPVDLGNQENFSITSSRRKITDEGLRSCGTSIVPPGSIILSTRAPIGLIGVSSIPLCTNQGCKSLVPLIADISTNFVAYALKANSSKLASRGKGTTFMELSADELAAFKILLPPFSEQQAISAFLDLETAKIDRLIQKQEEILALYDEKIKALVMANISPEKSSSLRLEHCADLISRPVNQVPGVEYRPLGLFNRGRGIFIKEERETEDMGDSDFFWVHKGDLIFSGQFAWEGAVAIANESHEGCVVSHRYPVIRGRDGIVLTEYLLALFLTSHGDFLLNENSRGAAGRNRPLNMGMLLKEKIPIAEMGVQHTVKKLLDQKRDLLEKSITSIELLKEHRSSLISAAITGKIDAREMVQ